MPTARWLIVAGAAAAMLCACSSRVGPARDPAADRAEIERVLRQWPRDVADRNAAAVCGIFAPDVVLSAAGGEDRNHEQVCAQFEKLFAGSQQTISYADPEIQDVFVDGDLGAVRLIWTATMTGPPGSAPVVEREQGLDVF
ncbi:MAG: nuclear transport factor 2 family protein, partial [Chloroflexi bacterium]|nr:nuclear transport factor 2 family protein [Chloroflexota bacterium]